MKKSLGYDLQGSLAEEIIVDERFIIKLDDALSYEEGALLEHLCCGYRLAIEVANWHNPDAQILIIGDGPMALADLRFLLAKGYKNVVLIGKHAERMQYAMRLGANQVIHAAEFLKVGNFVGFFEAIIFTINDESILEEIAGTFKKSARIFPQARISDALMLRFKTELGLLHGRAFAYHIDDFRRVMDLIKSGEVKLDGIVSSRIKMADVPGNTDQLFDKSRIKTVIINQNFH